MAFRRFVRLCLFLCLIAGVAFVSIGHAATTGLVAAYGFSEGTGTTTADASGNNVTGTLHSTTWTAAGKYGSALSFNGSSSYVDLGRPTPITSSTSSMSWEAWVMATATPPDDGQIIALSNGTSGWELKTTPDAGPRTFGVLVTGPGGAQAERTSTTVVALNTWYHVAAVYNASTQTLDLYVNGVLDDGALSGSVPASLVLPTNNVSIGRRAGGFYFNGTIDEVRVYSRALSQADIQTDMNTPVAATTQPNPPSGPATLTATVGNGAQADLSWSAATDTSGIASYSIERCSGVGCIVFAQVATTTGTTFNDVCLALNTSYSYRVRALDTIGNWGPYSPIATAAMPSTTSPSPPTNVTAAPTDSHDVQVSWTASTDSLPVSSYTLQRCQGAACTNFATAGLTSTTAYADSGLLANTAYSYRLQAIDSGSNLSACSTPVSTTTLVVAYPLTVSSNGRYLVDQHGQPVFWTGDAAWSLIDQLGNTDTDTYLSARQQQGFNVVLVNLIEHKFGNNAPSDINGDPPFTGTPFTTPNEAYFAHADYTISSAAQKGINVLLDPLFVGVNCDDEGWCAEVQNASVSDMQAWGQYVGNRYRSFDNIVWVVGGDADPGAAGIADKVNAFAAALAQADGRHPITAHNAIGEMAVTPWPGATWLSLNSTYARFGPDTYQLGQTAYASTPVLPFFQIEGYYENEHSMTTQSLRTQAYWTVLSGGFGTIFGNCPLWNFGASAGLSFCTAANPDWHTQLNTPGATGIMNLNQLFAPRAWQNLVPDVNHTTLIAGYGSVGA